ncbi:MAG: peptide-methionine (S)-S-oxide reductase MsrA [Anaerolineae bacterium]|nr:peptide-methionine (S)-S-oxide reductase MsrA [Anaerolineae bacterium]
MSRNEVTTLAGGCFWCLEAVYDQLEGVLDVVSGYAGGHVHNPTYEQVCSKTTGHAEVVQITFDPDVVSFTDLLDVFFTIHDPTTPNRQGADVGPQYRSAIFFHTPEQQAAALAKIAEYNGRALWPAPIVTEVTPISNYFPAEDYHQEYFARNPYQGYCMMVVAPKVAKFRKLYFERLKKSALIS